ncbi:phosphatase PAP2 family protein [Hymenobacter arizonensis]|uniref:phosphatase PAP2 family protein n=1 Tax=Hymenobacter arizonensis TaxID=1227077 RepID=UPI0015A6CE13|nr:phosphatase PAP2 family protein [Hymenobacter arizonensis]
MALLGRPQSAAACVQDTASIAVLDTTWQFKPTKPITESQPFYKNKLFCASIVPAILITYGASTINSHGIYSSYAARADVQRTFNTTRTRIDDYLQFAPYLEIGAVLVAGVNSRDDRLNLGLVVLKSELIMLSSVYLVKTLTGLERPDESARNSFPSGHTAQAFLAATIVHTEFRDKSQWYGVGAYAMASTVGVCRMINNKHWQSDVVAGAGFGILSAHLAYLSHRSRWGRKPIGRDVGVLPLWSPAGGTGLSLTWQPK